MGWSVLGAGIDAAAGRRDNMFNKKEADRARDWAKEMSNTEVRRRVADLKAAGLNPMLAAMSGASTPGSQAAQASGNSTDFQGAFSAAQMLRMAKEKNAAEVAQIEANTAKTVEETKQLATRTPYSAGSAAMEYQILGAQMQELNHKVSIARSEAEVRALLPEMQEMLNQAQKLDMTRRQAEEKFFDQMGEGSKWLQVVKDLLIGIRSMR